MESGLSLCQQRPWELHLGHLPDLLNSLGDNVVTDLHVNDLEAMYSLLKDVDTKSILHVSFDDTNFLYECGYPANCGAAYIYAHDRTYAEIAHYVQNVFVDPTTLGQHAQVAIQDASGRGLDASGRWTQLFKYLSVNAISGGKDAATAAWLAQYFGVTVTQPPAATAATGTPRASPTPAVAGGGGVLVILGQGEDTAFLGNPGVGR